MTKAYIMEYERGWGSRVDEVKEFPTRAEAEKWAAKYNAKYNTAAQAPDWYMTAQVER